MGTRGESIQVGRGDCVEGRQDGCLSPGERIRSLFLKGVVVFFLKGVVVFFLKRVVVFSLKRQWPLSIPIHHVTIV